MLREKGEEKRYCTMFWSFNISVVCLLSASLEEVEHYAKACPVLLVEPAAAEGLLIVSKLAERNI